MAQINSAQQTVYRSPTAGRRFLTARAAADAEARALIVRKYPTERPAYSAHSGMCEDGGWHWSSDERLVRAQARLSRMILKSFRRPAALPPSGAGEKTS